LAAGLAGLGIIQAPNYAVHEAVKAGRLVPLLQDWRTPVTPVYVVYPLTQKAEIKATLWSNHRAVVIACGT
jgi:DNA-binding transcriptional LysR family regulator